ncbi:MAG: CPBP family intramembrane metalloprotease [Bacteroidales bacterium]|nr:CPBP family intramembrane metalloprotease [Bacteroidales bacterium]
MAFFKKHQGRASYELFSNYAHYLPGFGGMIGMFALFLLGSLLGSLISGAFILMMGSSDAIMQYSMLIAYPVSFIPPLLYASAKSRRNEYFDKGYALDSNNFGVKGGFKMAVIVSVATLAAAFVCEPLSVMLPDMPETLKKSLEMLMNGPLWVALLSVSVFAPLFEEWLCRGLVLRGLLKHMNPTGAILTSAAFFAVLHMNPWQAIPAFILGILFGYVYYRTGSLKLTMLMHCVNNTFSVLLSRIPGLEDIESFMDILSPWAYAGIYLACVLMLASAVILITGIPVKDTKMGGCDEVDAMSID